MTEKQWNEFLDKLDFVQLADRWELLPLHWLDPQLPENSSELSRALVEQLLSLRDISDDGKRQAEVQSVCEQYRTDLNRKILSLDARLCPPGSRVTLRYLDPRNLGEADCLITVGSWDRVGYLIAELAHPGGNHDSVVGEEPVRREPGKLNFRNVVVFPDKGTPSPRAFRGLCEKALRQARGLGAKHLKVTHLHLPQTGLADRFAAAEVVSAVRQMLREGPGTTVEILAFSHRNYQDYEHWFESLRGLAKGGEANQHSNDSATPSSAEPNEAEELGSEVADAFKSFAQRSTNFASEATASVSRWFSSEKTGEVSREKWVEPCYHDQILLNQLYVGRCDGDLDDKRDKTDPLSRYIFLLGQTLKLEQEPSQSGLGSDVLLDEVRKAAQLLGETYPLTRYFRLLDFRVAKAGDRQTDVTLQSLLNSARRWEDLPLASFLKDLQEDTQADGANPIRPPVFPRGSRATID